MTAFDASASSTSDSLIGPTAARLKLAAILNEVLHAPRDKDQLQRDVLKMRAEMALHKHPTGELDAKLLRGGLVDLEFLIHFFQLREGIALQPDLARALCDLIAGGKLPAELGDAYALMTRLLVAARLLAPDGKEPSGPACSALSRACGMKDFAALKDAFDTARRHVAAAWTKTFGEPLEIER